MNKKTERIKWKAELKNYLARWDGYRIDEKGFIRPIKRTQKALAKKLHTSPMTIYRWLKTGNVSPIWKEKLLKSKIIRKDYL